MQNTRRIAIVGMAAAMAFGLAACGKKDEAKPAASGADAQPQAQASSSGITGARWRTARASSSGSDTEEDTRNKPTARASPEPANASLE